MTNTTPMRLIPEVPELCESPAGWNLPEIQSGLLCTPRHISEHLQWLTHEGQDLYFKRKETVDVFKREETALSMSISENARHLSNKIIVIDLGAGLSNKTITMFNCLTKTHPDRQIYYIPVDLNDVIFSWKDHLEKEHPHLQEHIVKVKPVIMDMLDAVRITEELINDETYKDWEILFSLFGPMSTILHNTYFIELIQEVYKVLANRGSGGFVFSYLPSYDGIEERINQEYYNKIDMPAIMKCVLIGLNKVVGSKVDPDMFDYEKEFISDNTTPGIEGKWSGFAIYASAKEDMEFFCKKLKMMIPLKKGQHVRLSEDIVKAHYYEDEYIISLAETTGLGIRSICQEPSGLISCVYMEMPNALQCSWKNKYTSIQSGSPRTH